MMRNWMSQVESAVTKVNGRRRARTISPQDVVQWIKDTRDKLNEGEADILHGGHVATSYGYVATSTGCCLAKCHGGRCFFRAKEVSASKGATGFGSHIKKFKGMEFYTIIYNTIPVNMVPDGWIEVSNDWMIAANEVFGEHA